MVDGRRWTHYTRDRRYTSIVYGGAAASMEGLSSAAPPPPADDGVQLYWGEIHGHTELSDGQGTLDEYFSAARDIAGLDFCAVTDHDHGGVGRPELWGDKWSATIHKVVEYHAPDSFVTLLAYERDSWPWYANLCLYYRGGEGELFRGIVDGEITRDELSALLARPDILAIPHHTAEIRQGASFDHIPLTLMPRLIEVYSKWGASEYMGNPRHLTLEGAGGHWRDALICGARMGCVAGSDVHSPHPGLVHKAGGNLRYDDPGLVAVWATELTREAVYDAMYARRCYGASGARIMIDFRINGARMGAEIVDTSDAPRDVWLDGSAPAPLQTVELLKNEQPYLSMNIDGAETHAQVRIGDRPRADTDWYRVRVTLTDTRQAWSSPIWVN